MGGAASCGIATVLESKPSFYQSYELGKLLGKGAYGTVYVAVSRRKRVHAVKVQSLRIYSRRVESEILIWKEACKHSENIVYLNRIYQEADVYFMVMELCRCTVHSRLEENPVWLYGELVDDFQQILRGMLHLHSMNIFHGDVKSQNVLYGGSDGQILKIADFGISCVLQPDQHLISRRGTLVYMAPEMFGENVCYSFPADMWSVGVLFFCIVVGMYPVGHASSTFEDFQVEMEQMGAEPKIVPRLVEKLNVAIQRRKSMCQEDSDTTPSQVARSNIEMLEKRLSLLSFAQSFLTRDTGNRPKPLVALQSHLLERPRYHREINSLLVVDRSSDTSDQTREAELQLDARHREDSQKRSADKVENENCQRENKEHSPSQQGFPVDKNDDGRAEAVAEAVGASVDTKNLIADVPRNSQIGSSSIIGNNLGHALSSHERGMAIGHPLARQAIVGSSLASLQEESAAELGSNADGQSPSLSEDGQSNRPVGLLNFEDAARSRTQGNHAVQPPADLPFMLVMPGQQPDAVPANGGDTPCAGDTGQA